MWFGIQSVNEGYQTASWKWYDKPGGCVTLWPHHWTTTLGTTLLWAKQMKSLESDETSTSSQLKIIVIYMWEITCSLHNNFQLSEIVSGVWEMRNFKKFDCLVSCSIIATRPSDKSTVTATRPVWLCHSSGTIGRWFWRPLIAPDRCVFARGNTQSQIVVSLLPEPGFLAKNQLPTQAPEWITVPGIAHLNLTEPERMLCPVRQLKLYIRDSERIRGGRQRMFIHWNRSIRDIMRSQISRWIVETVKEAYTQADRQYDCVTAHEVRALSASWAYNCQVALPDILSAAFWRSSGVFQNSYLRDMACIAEGMSTLGPVVVAQHVVDPGHLHPPP